LDPASVATWEGLPAIATNDFGAVVARRHTIIGELVDELRSRGAAIAMLSGSGSTVFGVFDDAPDAAAIARSTGHSALSTRTSDRVVRVELDR
jgi:4-diphosphocytidyl-2-C-methyl-D-erythritol kinase